MNMGCCSIFLCPPEKLLELINEFSNVAGYKINTQKSLAFLYTDKEQSKNEVKKIIPFTIASKKKIKYLGINLTKEIKDLYTKYYKTLLISFIFGSDGNFLKYILLIMLLQLSQISPFPPSAQYPPSL